MLIALPEIIVLATTLLAFVFDLLFLKRQQKITPYIAMAGLSASLASLYIVYPLSGSLLGGRFVLGSGAIWFKLIFILSALFTVAISTASFETLPASKKSELERGGEFVVLILLTLLGMLLLTSARDLVTIYVSLELSTIPLFLLSAWSRSSLSSEAGLKYVVLGAMSSALLLFGMSIVYGLSGEMTISAITAAIQPSTAFWYALALIGAGVGFKLALFPFHMWAPDVYEGAPTPVTAYLSVASKTPI